MSAQTLPGSVIRIGLHSARLPLSTAERLVGRVGLDISAFPPVAAYDAVEAQFKMVIGRLLSDEALFEEGERQEEAIRRRAGAARMAARAADVRDAAEERLDGAVSGAERLRDDVHERAEQRRAEIEREEAQARRQAEEKARRREEAERRAARTRQKAVEAKERQAELERIKAESEALDRRQEAVDADRVVTAIDERLEEKKTARRSGRTTANNNGSGR